MCGPSPFDGALAQPTLLPPSRKSDEPISFLNQTTTETEMNDNLSPAERMAAEQANEMGRKLEHCTPAQLGWPGSSAEELIASEYRCWLMEEMNEARRVAR